MMKILNSIFISLLLSILISCGSKTKETIPVTSNDSIKQSTSDTIKTSNWNGTYTDEFGGTLTISNFDKARGFDFKLLVVTNTESEDACTGEISGKAIIGKPNNASYDIKDDDIECHLAFKYDGNKSIEIGETDCISMHGGQCGFEGIYKKE